MATASTGPRYAPEDPTLPKPWRGLVDGNTGYLYFWNPETNVTQYERPVPLPPPPPPPGPPPPSTPKLASVSVSSSVHLQHSENPAHGKHGGSHGQQIEDPSSNYGQRHGSGHSTGMRSSEGHHHHYDGNGDVGRSVQPKLAPIPSIPSARTQPGVRNDSGQLQNGPIAHLNGSHGQSYSSNQSFRSSGRTHGSDSGNAMPADVYRRQHEITTLVCIWNPVDTVAASFSVIFFLSVLTIGVLVAPVKNVVSLFFALFFLQFFLAYFQMVPWVLKNQILSTYGLGQTSSKQRKIKANWAAGERRSRRVS